VSHQVSSPPHHAQSVQPNGLQKYDIVEVKRIHSTISPGEVDVSRMTERMTADTPETGPETKRIAQGAELVILQTNAEIIT